MKGLIFNIKKYSVHDGPGIRVTFFMKGCPMKCIWCHNPEGISSFKQNIIQTEKVGSKLFREVKEVGKYYTEKDIVSILDGEKIFIDKSGGGVTFSGGEPLYQADFLKTCLKLCRAKGYHTTVDTCGYAPVEKIREILPYADMFLFDMKVMDDERHIQLTGVSNQTIISNYLYLLEAGKEVMVRIPVVRGYNDDSPGLESLRKFLSETKRENLLKICLLPFHRTGVSKYRNLGLKYCMNETEPPSAVRMKELKRFFEETGIKVRIGG